jgi:SGNH hydrolase-like domain, acetyltransferase AlgX
MQETVGRGALRLVLAGGICALGIRLWADPGRSPNVYLLAGFLAVYLLGWGGLLAATRRRRSELAKGFVVATTAGVACVILLEALVLLRLLDFRVLFGTPAAQPWSHPGNLVDPTLLHLHQPHDEFVWDGIPYRYDRNGFRNRSELRTADVVVVGDSFIEGWGVTAPDLMTARLASDLRRPVANLGQSWYGPQQELEVLRRYGLPLHPRVVVWAFFEGNDLQDVGRYEEALPVWSDLSRRNHSFALRSFTRNALYAIRRFVQSHSETDATGTLAYPSGVFHAADRDVRMYFEYKAHRLSPREEAALGRLGGILAEADRLCRRQGSRLLVVFVPSKDRVYKDRCRFARGAEPLRWPRNDLPRRLEVIVHREVPDADFLDLTPGFLARAARGEVLYFPRDTHWSPRGHAAAAEAIAARLGHRAPQRVTRTGLVSLRTSPQGSPALRR